MYESNSLFFIIYYNIRLKQDLTIHCLYFLLEFPLQDVKTNNSSSLHANALRLPESRLHHKAHFSSILNFTIFILDGLNSLILKSFPPSPALTNITLSST